MVVSLGEPAYRAEQVARHYFVRLTTEADDMSDLPAGSRDGLVRELLPALLTPERELVADGGLTHKSLWRLYDGAMVESVLMRYGATPTVAGAATAALGAEADDEQDRVDGAADADAARPHPTGRSRVTMCVSSQVGCGMACPFCATGQLGLTRNLSTGEIIEQVLAGARALAGGEVPGGPGRVTNVVFMGMGEPMANYVAVIGAVRRLTDPAPAGLGMSARGVTVSTVGLVPRMRQLAEEGIPVTLALSLHAPDDELRNELVPINSRWPVADVLDAARDYARVTGRRVSIEYALMRDINDQQWRAQLLADLLRQRGKGWVHVNPIPLNPTPGSKWTASRRSDEQRFVRTLRDAGIPTTVRDTRGSDIDAACGQLAAGVGNA